MTWLLTEHFILPVSHCCSQSHIEIHWENNTLLDIHLCYSFGYLLRSTLVFSNVNFYCIKNVDSLAEFLRQAWTTLVYRQSCRPFKGLRTNDAIFLVGATCMLKSGIPSTFLNRHDCHIKDARWHIGMSSASHAVGWRFKPQQGRIFIYVKYKDEFELRLSNYINALMYG